MKSRCVQKLGQVSPAHGISVSPRSFGPRTSRIIIKPSRDVHQLPFRPPTASQPLDLAHWCILHTI